MSPASYISRNSSTLFPLKLLKTRLDGGSLLVVQPWLETNLVDAFELCCFRVLPKALLVQRALISIALVTLQHETDANMPLGMTFPQSLHLARPEGSTSAMATCGCARLGLVLLPPSK